MREHTPSRSPLRPPRSGLAVAAVVVVLSVVAGCGRGDDQDVEEEPLPVDETATVEEAEVAEQPASTEWNCGTLKQHVYAVVNTLDRAEAAAEGVIAALVSADVHADATESDAAADSDIAEQLADAAAEAASTAQDLLEDLTTAQDDETGADAPPPPVPDELEAAVEAARSGFGQADETALNSACQLYGQHDAALLLWEAGNTGDACDVWIPAAEAAEATSADIDIAAVHPLVSKFWVGATGSIAEGRGRCIAERMN